MGGVVCFGGGSGAGGGGRVLGGWWSHARARACIRRKYLHEYGPRKKYRPTVCAHIICTCV